MFEYFSDNYPWNMAVMHAVEMGAAISEIEDACRPLKAISGQDDTNAQNAWLENWKKIAGRVEGLAKADESFGHHLSAGRKYRRAAIYYLEAERMLPSTDPRKVQTYKQGLAACKKAIHLLNEPVEWVEVPFKDQSLPALFTKPSGKGPFPCMIHFDGFDMHKDFLYIMHADAFLKRGMAMLLVDHPGVGEALRLRGMPSKPDTEVPAAAAVDYLERRQDVYQDVYSDRIGIIAQSLGGYYAPRAAAFEKRFKCCIAFGAVWDWGELVTKRIRGKGDAGHKSIPKWEDHLMWVLGKDNIEDAVDVAKQMTLEGVAEKITCPFLIIHGENDRQIPLSHAEKTVEAAENSPKRELKVFTLAEGGAEHCQIDNRTMGLDYAADWAAEILGGNPKGI